MSVDYLPRVDRRPVPAPNNNLNISLSSNNPFRRGVSPNTAAKGPAPAPPTANGAFINNENEPFRSTNPFLDNYQAPSYPIPIPAQNARQSPSRQMPPHGYSQSASPKKPGFHVSAGAVPTKMMNGMSIQDRPAVGRRSPPRTGQPPSSFRAPPTHRHSRSNDENMRAGVPRSPEKLVDIFATPEKDKPAHGQIMRRNSDTSVMDEKEQRRKAREARAKDKEGKARDATKKSKKPNPQMDLIDKLDVTSIYGTGMFHHDGPFDACNPHRNRKGTKVAPMHAFPEGSANNTMGGSGPVNKSLDIDKFHGRVPDGFHDFNSANAITTAVPPPPQDTTRLARPGRQDRRPSAEPVILLDGRQKTEMVHGEQSAGLGTSTFLEGAPVPASRLALQRAVSQQDNGGNGGGLTRKKSLAQRIRGISRPRGQGFGDAGRVLSPDARYAYADDGRSALTPPVPTLDAQSGGGRGKMVEVNPFFHEQANSSAIGQAKTTNEGTSIEMPEKAAGRHRGISSPQPLYRAKTNDSTGGNDGAEAKPASSGGLLSRVKSMRGPRRPTRERRDT